MVLVSAGHRPGHPTAAQQALPAQQENCVFGHFRCHQPADRVYKTTEHSTQTGEDKIEMNENAKRPRILVVHSDAVVRQRFAAKLKTAGYLVDFASNANEAIRYVRTAEPDLVITGLMLDDANGIGLCDSLKELSEGYLPVIIVTRLSEPSVKVRALECHVDDLIAGELSAEELHARARLLLRFKHVHDELRASKAELEHSLERETELREQLDRDNEHLRHLSMTDPLTGLHNRRYFEQFVETQLRLALRHNHPVGILYLDLDGFKPMNDCFGHGAGDEILQQFAQLVRANVRECDLVARMGGDEVAVVLVESDAAGCRVLADRLCQTVRDHPFRIRDTTVSLTVSIGSACYPADSQANGYELLEVADRAMFVAKRKGRDRFCTSDDATEHHALLADAVH